ncbi:MAG: helix-turn-helix domain-containing protein [Candidatus Aminicenantes bacterium]|nr:helix-turn-helix domain-containing protein [Candidatus Aminicenantes bacterium]NIM81358.1 helix-turn-helix domain-containing protein [Candidatus Aminicenantes bacterium]NIN20769.1 helix-turn-helix domain-containing protein [Candidatus Aminicenantes bacterium]NIN44547.1 helix-turn-helix domain-containing protein [Candidatus Aminicenantes bacterium]NIN87367.1 helix-turn-helix domain-containing protein [Candidatus Aminicenantes bacterium]
MRNDLEQYIQEQKQCWEWYPEFKKKGIAVLTHFVVYKSECEDFQFLSVDWIARQLGISESYLSRCYKDFFKSSLYELIVQRKMTVARKLLLQRPDLSMDEIAAKLDYCDGNYFIKVFKKEVNITPHQFRLKFSKRKKRTRKGRVNTKY